MNNVNQLRRETVIHNRIIYSLTPGPFGVTTWRRRTIRRRAVQFVILAAFVAFAIALNF